nr:Cna B-type domain-containing protein [Streptococcus oralis]
MADVDGGGKIRGKSTGKIKAEVTTTNTLASSDQAIPEDTVKAEYDIIVYGKVNYNKNHADVTGEAPKDNNEYYPSITENGNDADTDKVTVLDAGTMKRSGYLFKGWNTQADGKGTMYSKGDTFKTGTIDKDVELYAIWSLIWAPMEIPTRAITVTKEWQGSDGNKIDAPVDSVTVELYKDGVATGQVQELTKANNWTASFEQQPVSATLGGEAHQYTVKEVGEILNNIQVTGKWYGVGYAGSMKEGFTITNKEKTPWAPMIPPTRAITVTKEWEDSAGNDVSAPVDSVKVELYKDGVGTGQLQELTSDNNWTATFEQLPVSATLGGEAHQYTVKEVGEISNNIQLAGKWYGVRYEGSVKEGFTITNKEKTPTKPSTPNDPESNKPEVPSTSNNKILPKTGDASNVSQYAWIMLASGVLLMLMGYRRKNQG